MKPNVRILILTSNPRISERKTTRGALDRTRPSKPALSRTEKARNCLSPNGTHRNAAVPAANRAFVLPSRYGMAIVEIRGVNHQISTHFCVQRGRDDPIHVFSAAIPGVGATPPGILLR